MKPRDLRLPAEWSHSSGAKKLWGPPPLPELAADATPAERLDTIAQVVVAWWKSRRPSTWTERQHLETFAVNTSGPEERELAYVAAALVRLGKGR